MERVAECICGQLQAICTGEPDRNSVCHCLNCKRRSGSAFAWTASYPAAAVRTSGDRHSISRTNSSGRTITFHTCPACSSTVFFEIEMRPGMISVPAGMFADPDFPPPTIQVYEDRRVGWCALEIAPEDTLG